MWDGGEKMQSQMKFVNHFTPKGGRRGATHFHHIFSTAVTSNLLLTCRIFTWHQSSTPYIIFLHEQINQLIHSCTQKLRHDRTMKIINTFSKETNMKSVTHVHGCCVTTKFTVTTDNPLKLVYKVNKRCYGNLLKTGIIYINSSYLITTQIPQKLSKPAPNLIFSW